MWLWELRTIKDPTGHSARILTASSRDRWGWYHDDCSVTWSTKAKLTKPPLGVDIGFLFLVTGTEQLLLTQSWELSLDVIWLSLHLLQVTSSPLLFARLLTIFLSGWCWCWDPDSLSSRTWLFRSKLFFTWKQNRLSENFKIIYKNKFRGQVVWCWCPNILALGFIQGLKIIDWSYCKPTKKNMNEGWEAKVREKCFFDWL